MNICHGKSAKGGYNSNGQGALCTVAACGHLL